MDEQLLIAIADLIGALFLLAGGAVSLAAAIGVLRFPDTTTRAHAGAKPAHPNRGCSWGLKPPVSSSDLAM